MRWRRCAGWAAVACTVLAASSLAEEKAPERPDLNALARYLVKAALQGYASGDESRIQHLADGGSEVRSEEGDYVYRGRWYGNERFAGEDVVWHNGHALWSMNFYGATTPGCAIPAEFPKFHKSALRRVSVDAPFRGPAMYHDGEFVYVNKWTGSISEFSGEERVFFRDQEIFHLVYHGGTLHK
jgi:hypothetical protein